jgi:hypothetical protein
MAEKPCRSLPSSSDNRMPNEVGQLEFNRCRDGVWSNQAGSMSYRKPIHSISAYAIGRLAGQGDCGRGTLAAATPLWV